MGRVSAIGIATRYGLDGPGIESKTFPVAERSKTKDLPLIPGWDCWFESLRNMDVCVVCCTVKVKGKMQEN